jgi:hypothetical protein
MKNSQKSYAEIELDRFYVKNESIVFRGEKYEEFGRNLLDRVLKVEREKEGLRRNLPWKVLHEFDISSLAMLATARPAKERLRQAKEVLKLNEEGNTDQANALIRKYIDEMEESIKTHTERGNTKKRKHPVKEILEEIYIKNKNIMGKNLEDAIKDPHWGDKIIIVGGTIYPKDKRYSPRKISGLPSIFSRLPKKK